MPDRGRWHAQIAMVVAMGCWAGNDALVKLCAGQLPAGPILALRGAFALVLLLAVLALGRYGAHWRALARPLVALRCALEFGAALTAVWALSLAPLATVTALAMLAPMLAALGAAGMGWERTDRWRTLAIGVGMCGALLVVAPWHGPGAEPWGIASGLACALCLAARDLSTRQLAHAIPAPVLTLATTATACIAGLGLWVFDAGASHPVQATSVWALAGAAVCATAANLCLMRALRLSAVGALMPLRFTLLPWAALLGALIWDEHPTPAAWIGLGLIALGGIAGLRLTSPASRRAPPV